ncbi:MAG TPA: type II toxin-antitoxin system RelE/ParE family toxin [Hymenobacter sp.]|jgi:hypothetical protein
MNSGRKFVANKIVPVPPFTREVKRLLKKFPSLDRELQELLNALAAEAAMGTAIGRNCYKIRLKIASKGKGGSGGARVITCVVAVEEAVYLLSIYDKSEQTTISDKRLEELLKLLPAS